LNGEVARDTHSLDGCLEEGVTVPAAIFWLDDVAFSEIFCVENDAIFSLIAGEDFDLYFRVWVDADVEDPTVSSKPGIGPTTIVTDA
jgi:hypothetical protein